MPKVEKNEVVLALISEKLGDMDKKLDRVDGRLDTIDVTIGKQQVILEEHVKRTSLLEDRLEKDLKSVDEKVEPLKIFTTQMKFVLKIVALLAGSGVGVGGIWKLVSVLLSGAGG